MTTTENLLKYYARGFKDESTGTSSVVSDSELENKAYQIGANHASNGRKCDLSGEDLLLKIKEGKNE